MDNQEETLNLGEIFLAIARGWKKTAVLSLVLVLFSLALSFYFSGFSRYQTVIEIGGWGNRADRTFVPFEDPRQLVTKINSDSYRAVLENSLGKELLNDLTIKAAVLEEETSLVKITADSKNPDSAKKALEQIGKIITEEYIPQFQQQVDFIEEKNSFLKKEIEIVKTENERLNSKSSLSNELAVVLKKKINAFQAVPFLERNLDMQISLIEAVKAESQARQEAEDAEIKICDNEIKINSIEGQIAVSNSQLRQIAVSSIVGDPSLVRQSLLMIAFRNGCLAAILGLFIGSLLALSNSWFRGAPISASKYSNV